jgi:hypothetical protein
MVLTAPSLGHRGSRMQRMNSDSGPEIDTLGEPSGNNTWDLSSSEPFQKAIKPSMIRLRNDDVGEKAVLRPRDHVTPFSK